MHNSQEVASTIKTLLKSKGISAGKMLSDLELNKNSLFTMQTSGYLPRAETLVKIADYLDCSVDYLLGRTDVPEVNKRDEEVTVYKVAARGGEKEIKLNAAQRAELERIINEHKDDDNSDLV